MYLTKFFSEIYHESTNQLLNSFRSFFDLMQDLYFSESSTEPLFSVYIYLS